jgi:hypothetical protein
MPGIGPRLSQVKIGSTSQAAQSMKTALAEGRMKLAPKIEKAARVAAAMPTGCVNLKTATVLPKKEGVYGVQIDVMAPGGAHDDPMQRFRTVTIDVHTHYLGMGRKVFSLKPRPSGE